MDTVNNIANDNYQMIIIFTLYLEMKGGERI